MLEREFDLTPRIPAGSRTAYICSDVFSVLDDAGRVAHQERRSAALTEEVTGLNHDGARSLRWRYENFAYDVNGQPGSDPEAFASGGSIVFGGVPESADAYPPPLDALGLATSPVAWLTAELVIHTRAFAIMATRAHGGIEQLRRVGDTTLMPWSGREDRLVFGELLDVTIVRSRSVLSLDGLTIAAGRPAALLGYHCPYDLRTTAFEGAHVEVRGTISIDVESGAVLAGSAHQANYIAGAPRADGTTGPMAHRIDTTLELASG